MRIISGVFKGIKLNAPKGNHIRPTLDRVRETIFNILEHASWASALQANKEKWHILDLFCGTGALGIEALSRGGRKAIFCDADAASLALCKKNCKALHLERSEKSALFHHLPFDKAAPLIEKESLDLIFLDPPYNQGLLAPALELCAPLLKETGILIAEAEKGFDIASIPNHCEMLKEKKFKNSVICFLRKKS